jgi:hypothetical protein
LLICHDPPAPALTTSTILWTSNPPARASAIASTTPINAQLTAI